MKDIFLLVVEWDNYYDTKEFDSYAFTNVESAEGYMEDLIESIKIDFMDRFECETEEQLLSEYLEIDDHTRSLPHKSLYVEDDCYVSIYVEKKSLMSFMKEE